MIRSGIASLIELVVAIPFVSLSFVPLLFSIPRIVGDDWASGLAFLVAGMLIVAIVLIVTIAVLSRLGRRRLGADQSFDTPQRFGRLGWSADLTGRSAAYTTSLLAFGGALAATAVMLLTCGMIAVLVPIVMVTDDDQIQILGAGVHGWVRASLAGAGGVILILAALWATAGLGRLQAHLARAFLIHTEPEELVELTTSRHRMLQGFDAERRRIERDLHDGVQPLLVSVSMKLGLARSVIEAGSPGHADLVAAHTQAKQLMGVMRELVHGIYPRALVESGLETAFRDLASKSVVPTRVRADSFPRCSPEVEAVAYFSTSELLNNTNKHSGATEATIELRFKDDFAVIDVRDNGCGGAAHAQGTGLTGVADRVATVGGTVYIASPEGGPTLVRLRLPAPGTRT